MVLRQFPPMGAYETLLRFAADYAIEPQPGTSRVMLVKSNPSGVATGGDELNGLIDQFAGGNTGALIDEACEFYCDPEPESALKYIRDIDDTNIFAIGAATKGLQVPGMRNGWAIASKEHIEVFRNYTRQRNRYGEGLAELGFDIDTGSGGFYHWGRLPLGLTGDDVNEQLFAYEAGILPGRLCNMARKEGAPSALEHFSRFSFGPLGAESYDDDMRILREALS